MKKISLVLIGFFVLSIAQADAVNPSTPARGPEKPNQISKETPMMGDGAIVVKKGADFFPGKCGKRKVLGGLVTVYDICVFVKGVKPKEWESVFAAKDKAFKLKLSFLRGIGGKKVSSAFSDALSKVPVVQKSEEAERKKFLEWAAGLKVEKESVMEISFMDEKAFRVAFSAKNSATPQLYDSTDKALSKSVASIWLGANPVQQDIKDALLQDL